jgi:toxin CptA
MPRSHRSSNASASCRLEWRPSRLLGAMLGLIGALAVVALLGSALPRPVAIASSVLVAGYSARLLRGYLGSPARLLVIPGGELAATLDGVALRRLALQWRGPLAFLAWQDSAGQRGHLAWWPDTLDARQRRELRLAAGAAAVSPTVAAVAP